MSATVKKGGASVPASRSNNGHCGTQVTPRQKVFGRLSLHQCRLLVRAEKDEDIRLLHLAFGVGQVSDQIRLRHPLNAELERIAAWTIGWAESLASKDVCGLVHAERDRQNALFAEGKLPFTCASRTADAKRKLRVLVEEIGEVAEAIDMLEGSRNTKAAAAHLIDELIQVAAVCVAWLESLEPKEGK
jgi:hypothetical protein